MPEFPPVPARLPERPEDSNSLGLEGVGQAFGRAVKSQLHPRMLLAMLLPFVIMFVGAIVLLLVALGPLTAWMDRQITESAAVVQADQWLVSLGLFSVLTLKAFSLPSVGEDGASPHIELGVKGDEQEACAQALEFLRSEALRLGAQFESPKK